MEVSKTAVGIVAGLCIGAGAGGAYLATRSNAPAETVIAEAPLAGTESSVVPPVDATEGIIVDNPAPAAASVAPPPPAPRQTPARTNASTSRESRPAASRPVVAPRVETQSAPTYEARVAPPPALEPAQPVESEPVRVAERPAEPPAPAFEELIVSADSVVGLQVETAVNSERAQVEDEVIARVTRDVRVGDRVAIPAGSLAHGEVTLVERGGKVRERARLGIRFTSVVLADGTRVPLETDTIYREGDAPSGESAAKIGGGAIGGAIIGGILGGARGAVIGGTAGAGAGTAAVLAGGRNPATLPAGTPVTVRVIKPTTVTVEK